MKKLHYQTSKFNSTFSFSLAVIFLLIISLKPDLTLFVAMIFLIIYVTGNGVIHSKNNKLERDTLIEYILLSIITLVIIVGAII